MIYWPSSTKICIINDIIYIISPENYFRAKLCISQWLFRINHLVPVICCPHSSLLGYGCCFIGYILYTLCIFIQIGFAEGVANNTTEAWSKEIAVWEALPGQYSTVSHADTQKKVVNLPSGVRRPRALFLFLPLAIPNVP